jgi:hypothetical protein
VLDATMSAWLRQVGAADGDGVAHVPSLAAGWAVAASVAPPTRALAQAMVEGATRPLVTTFDYAGCGRVAYSSFHALGRDDCPPAGCHFPNYCAPVPSTPQERVMEYLLFDAASCVAPAP